MRNNALGSPRIDASRSTYVNLPTATRQFSRSAVLTRYEQELAYYRADAPYLTVEKCAERCRTLSALFAAATTTAIAVDRSHRAPLH
jgi:hypothetical protein